jgi:hypothetical protein
MRPLINEMVSERPEDRPDIHDCVDRLDDIVSSLPTWKLRSQVVYSTDWTYEYIWRLLPHLFRLISYIWLNVPPVPSRTVTD